MKRPTRVAALFLPVSATLLIISLGACAPTPRPSHVSSMDEVVANIHDPAMKEVWMAAQAQQRLPPAKTIPIPDTPVSQRQVAEVRATPAKPRRPVIPQETPIAVQPFSEEAIARYEGPFEVISHDAGVLKGRLQGHASPLEIFYKLPEREHGLPVRSESLYLRYRDEVVGAALQRRIILFDQKTKRAPLIAISEGSPTPYQTLIRELGLVIEQTTSGDKPAVRVGFGENSITVQEGERNTIGEGQHRWNVYLLNSYVQDTRHADVDPGPPYYVNIILYQ